MCVTGVRVLCIYLGVMHLFGYKKITNLIAIGSFKIIARFIAIYIFVGIGRAHQSMCLLAPLNVIVYGMRK